MDRTWDDRYWLLALKSDKPAEVYSEIVSQMKTDKDAPKLEELPAEQQAWLRATS